MADQWPDYASGVGSLAARASMKVVVWLLFGLALVIGAVVWVLK